MINECNLSANPFYGEIDELLAASRQETVQSAEKQEISSVGREEWFTIRNMIEGYENLDTYMKQVLLFYGRPFSEKFMKQFD